MIVFDSQRGFIYYWFNPDFGSRLQELINPVRVGQENASVLLVCQYGLLGLATVGLAVRGFTACRGSFPSCSWRKIIPTPSQVGR